MRTINCPPRSMERIRQHYEVEKRLANRLRNSRKEDRAGLYSEVYNELFHLVPDHPQLCRRSDAKLTDTVVAEKMQLLSRFLDRSTVFLELGAGDCRLSLNAAELVRQVYALDVSAEITRGVTPPPNFQLVLSNGTDIPVPAGSVSVAYSYQLMEHIHPEDALEQLRNIYQVLAPGGVYICVTPNRLAGPHDVSRYFDTVAKGFHLREYTLTELEALFRGSGFRDVRVQAGGGGHFVSLPLLPVRWLESALGALPASVCRRVSNAPALRNILLAAVVGTK
jgi:SAM-dependent methyltransferase